MSVRIKTGSKADQTIQLIAAVNADAAIRFSKGFCSSVLTITCDDDLEALNRYWRAQFARLEVDTSIPRMYLSHSTDFQAWLFNFRRHVLPMILKHELPYV